MADQPAALTFADATGGYGKHTAFEGISGSLLSGGCLGIIGPNGAGKTTLMKAVMGLLPLQRGSVELSGALKQKRKGNAAYVQQSADLDLNFPVSARDVVMMGRYRSMGWLRRARRADHDAVDTALERVDMASLARRPFGSLSGGQRQRVLLARAIAQGSGLLLMDEPFNGVDAVTTEMSVLVLTALQAEGAALVISTHDLDLARTLCSDVLLMNNRQIAFGPIAQTLTPANLTETFGAKSLAFDAQGSVITTG